MKTVLKQWKVGITEKSYTAAGADKHERTELIVKTWPSHHAGNAVPHHNLPLLMI